MRWLVCFLLLTTMVGAQPQKLQFAYLLRLVPAKRDPKDWTPRDQELVKAHFALLESVRLTLEAVDADGIVTRQEKPEFALSEARESVCEFPVPDRLARLRVRLSARVRNVSRQREETLAAEQMLVIDFDSQKRAFLFR